MSSHSLHEGSDGSAVVTHPDDARPEGGPSTVRISLTVVNHHTLHTPLVTGRQIKEKAGVPAGFSLYRRTRGGNEPILDDAPVELRDGDHFFALPSTSAR